MSISSQLSTATTINSKEEVSVSQADKNTTNHRYKRSKNKHSCEHCKKRKIKCDSGKSSAEGCSNCVAKGIKCVVEEKEPHSNLKKKYQRKKYQRLLLETTITTPNNNIEKLNHQDPFVDFKGDEIIVDPENVLSRKIDPKRAAKLSKVLNCPFTSKDFMFEFFNTVERELTIRDLATSQCIKNLIKCGCFILPNKSKCQQYIDSYFKIYHPIYPTVAKESFLQNNTGDRLSNPESLLLLRCVLFMGCFAGAKTPKERQEAVFLFEKANMLCSANLEQVGVHIVASLLILRNKPKLMLMNNVSPEDQLVVINQTARIFGMDKDADSDETLTIEEKQLYKILFWLLVFMDKIYALTFSKNFYFDTKNRHNSVKRLTKDDFSTIGMENPESSFLAFAFELVELMDTVSELQTKANLAALKFQPFLKHVEEVDQAIKRFNEKTTKSEDDDKNYSVMLQLFVHTLNIVMQRVNLFRIFIVCNRAVHMEVSPTLAASYLESESEKLCSTNYWESLKESVFSLCKFVTKNILNYKDVLLFCQHNLNLCFHGMCHVIPFLYYTDEEVRDTAYTLLKDARPVARKLKMMDYIIWPMIDTYYFILTDVYTDPVKVNEYVRSTVVIPNCERLWKDIESNHNFDLVKSIVLHYLPPFEHPFLKINGQTRARGSSDQSSSPHSTEFREALENDNQVETETIQHPQEMPGITGSTKNGCAIWRP
ncbi:unnamed protein product [Ambrosiozyma monospora]|uniref:Unnamed protein product n=1 Tax=Ambrosiozyma monospora TaxID=43982 RepID=A0A9W6Z2Z5_AMBMO|nr:unnamed protein product [Ambrosiozyma monospora]